jgi:hypothetical protein
MANRGGYRPNSGRKPKAEELRLVETLSPLEPLVLEHLQRGIEAMDFRFIKLYMQYYYGLPKRIIELEHQEPIAKNLPSWLNEASDEELEIVDNIITKNS